MCDNGGPSQAELKFQPLKLAGPGDIWEFNGKKRPFANRFLTTSSNFTLLIKNVLDGGHYQLMIIKTTAADIVITFPASTLLDGLSTTNYTLSGPLNSTFLLPFTYKP